MNQDGRIQEPGRRVYYYTEIHGGFTEIHREVFMGRSVLMIETN